jgi:tRNA threonylcarbamoyladenosine biosynthesis protein TsaB
MNLLVIDTSSVHLVVGLRAGKRPPLVAASLTDRKHGRDLIPRIKELFDLAGLAAADLNTIGVGVGPGSYTGLRIGVTAAKIMAYATGAGLIGFDSLHGWAESAPRAALRVHVVADAQRDDVYTSELTRAEPGARLIALAPTRIEPLGKWTERLSQPASVIGPGLSSARVRAALPGGLDLIETSSDHRLAESLLEMTARLWNDRRGDDLWTLEPNYLRRSAAEDQWEARERMTP